MTRFTSLRAAAQHVGLTPAAVREWVARGHLPPMPEKGWTARQLATAQSRRAEPLSRPGATAPHGTVSRWRGGCSCDECTAAHSAESQRSRSAAQQARWDAVEGELLRAIAGGAAYADALEKVGMSTQAASGHRRRDPGFAARLDDALMTGRPDVRHGTSSGWRRGCRCPECREYHEAGR